MRFARIDSRESFATATPIFIARQADSHESLEFPIRANHPIRAKRANRFARITPLRFGAKVLAKFAAKFFTKFSGLFCRDIQSNKKLRQNLSPKFPEALHSKIGENSGKTS